MCDSWLTVSEKKTRGRAEVIAAVLKISQTSSLPCINFHALTSSVWQVQACKAAQTLWQGFRAVFEKKKAPCDDTRTCTCRWTDHDVTSIMHTCTRALHWHLETVTDRGDLDRYNISRKSLFSFFFFFLCSVASVLFCFFRIEKQNLITRKDEQKHQGKQKSKAQNKTLVVVDVASRPQILSSSFFGSVFFFFFFFFF